MDSKSQPPPDERRRNARVALDPLITDTSVSGPSKLELVHQAIMAPFHHKKTSSAKILSDCTRFHFSGHPYPFPIPICRKNYLTLSCLTVAPVIMTPRMMNSANTISSRSRPGVGTSRISDFAMLGRAPLRLGMGSKRITSRDLQIMEATEELLGAEVPEPDGVASNVSLLRGFNATIPSAEQSRTRRRQMRNVDTPRIGLKKLGMTARGLLIEDEDPDVQSVTSEDDVVVVPRHDTRYKKGKRRARESLSASKILGKEELTRQKNEIMRDKENLHVRRVCLHCCLHVVPLIPCSAESYCQ